MTGRAEAVSYKKPSGSLNNTAGTALTFFRAADLQPETEQAAH